MRIFLTALAMTVLPLMGLGTTASAQIPGLPKIEFPNPSKTTKTSNKGQKVAGAGAGCVIGGALVYAGVKSLGKKFLQDRGYTGREVEQTAQLAAGVGCVVGGSAAVAMINRMDERSKQKQEEAWEQAKANTGGEPVSWEGPRESGYRGTVSAEKAEPMIDGTECLTRKDYVIDASGQEGTVYNRYCKNKSGDFEIVEPQA